MGAIRWTDTHERLEGEERVRAFLADQGIIYEKWDIGRLDGELKESYALSEEQKAAIIAAYRKEIDELSARRGYRSEDIVVLSEATPNLDNLLEMFRKEHHHTEDEVRFCVDGHGIFTIQGKDGRFFDVEMEPGDLISVPAGTRHWFSLMDDRKIKCIRIFASTEGWAAIYEKQQA
jgi:1,2-dihydroxy-3-keto-5-methylthiopentene dioxygenase